MIAFDPSILVISLRKKGSSPFQKSLKALPCKDNSLGKTISILYFSMSKPLKHQKTLAEWFLACILVDLWVGISQPGQSGLPVLAPRDCQKSIFELSGTPQDFLNLMESVTLYLNKHHPDFAKIYHRHRALLESKSYLTPYEKIRETISTLATYGLIQEPPRTRQPNRKRHFKLILYHGLVPDSLENIQQILKDIFGEGGRWDQAQEQHHERPKIASQNRETSPLLDSIRSAKEKLSQVIATNISPVIPRYLSQYSQPVVEAVDELLPIFQSSLNFTDSSQVNHHLILLALGNIYLNKQDFILAQKYFEKCLNLAQDLSLKAESLYRLGTIAHHNHHISEAYNFYIQSLKYRLELLGNDHPEIADSLYAITQLANTQQDWQKAEICLQRSLQIYQSYYGKKDYRLGMVQNQLGFTYEKLHRLTEAESTYQAALKILSSLEPHQAYPHLSRSQLGLGRIYALQEQNILAEKFYREAIVSFENFYGKQHSDLAFYKVQLACFYYKMRNFTQAIELYEEAIHILTLIYGKDYDSIGIYLKDMALIENQQRLGLD